MFFFIANLTVVIFVLAAVIFYRLKKTEVKRFSHIAGKERIQTVISTFDNHINTSKYILNYSVFLPFNNNLVYQVFPENK